ncbi:DUF1801 domain-containing protein [Tautonia plasticadhaerens]|uniref:YdhG-like domain-containing protein n=1 Tax=Tautonia plasticadhaerens TaxID=2527974 RepID=A0A518HCG3_9BACT|nr:DUF1801 domain-containing protein [Tautonia plasticadhaerens]QDV38548.1 hypothetical protein ElP_65030 [Tautonia plasticadhaerens]
MAELKTGPNDRSVAEFLEGVPDERRRADALAVLDLMQEATGLEPRMWGDSIVGFGSFRYKYESGREGDWFLAGFSPRKQNLTLYIMSGFDREAELMQSLGKYKTGKSCLYLKRLDDVDPQVLRELVRRSVEHTSRTPS